MRTPAHRTVLQVLGALLITHVLVSAGCGAIQPIERAPTPVLRLRWALKLYDLEMLAFEPREAGRPLFVRGGDGAPAGGLVVAPSQDRKVRGLRGADGALLWSFETEGANAARPVAVGADVLVASFDGHVYRARQADGGLVWKSEYPGRGSVLAAPVVADGRVFVTSNDNRLTVLSLDDGQRLWDRRRDHPSDMTITGQAGATVIGDHVVTGFSDGQVTCLAVSDGATVWTQDLSGGEAEFIDVDTTPVVVGESVVAASYRGGLYSLVAETGDVRWLLRGEGFDTPAVLDGVLYVPQSEGKVLAVDGDSGRLIWVAKLGEHTPGEPAVTRKYLVVPTGGTLMVLDRATGRTLSRYDGMYGFVATPEVAFGTAYAPSNDGHLYAFDVY